MFGYSREEVLGRRVAEFLVPPERQDENSRILKTIARGERVPRFETVRRHKDGAAVSTSATVSPIFGADGVVVGSTSVEHDLRAEHVAEDARVNVELDEAEVKRQAVLDKVRHTFISEASHELNTPLTPLTIHLEALSEGSDVTPRQREHLVVIERNVKRLANLVKDMLEASRLETGRFNLEHSDVPLAVLVEDAIQSSLESANSAGLTLESGPVAHLTVDADRNRVGQVLNNLLANAIGYTPKGGRIQVGAALEDGQAVVRVADTGIGLSADQIGALFQPFSRPHDGLGSGPKGTGLGLFISKGIIEQHGGRIWAESPGPGQGASFCFALPLARSSTPREANRAAVGRGASVSLAMGKPESALEKSPAPSKVAELGVADALHPRP